jgi:hypothetical protein
MGRKEFAMRFFSPFFGGVEPSPLLLRPITGLLYQDWYMMMMMDEYGTVGGKIDRETEVLGGNLPQWPLSFRNPT